jgi:hypothetical protein
MHLSFSLRGLAGSIDVTVSETQNPKELSARPGAAGLPHCQATVSLPGKGYDGLLGWIQLVCSTDNGSSGQRFEMDPLEILGDVPHPFCFFGIKPTLFNAPSRDSRADLDWLAHSFLCHIADRAIREVQALVGFSWGFKIADGTARPIPPRGLESVDWNQHLGLLHAEHPVWRFADGFRST